MLDLHRLCRDMSKPKSPLRREAAGVPPALFPVFPAALAVHGPGLEGPVKFPQQGGGDAGHRQAALPLAALRGGEGQAAEKAAVGMAAEVRVVAVRAGGVPPANPHRLAAQGAHLPPGRPAVESGLGRGEGAHLPPGLGRGGVGDAPGGWASGGIQAETRAVYMASLRALW